MAKKYPRFYIDDEGVQRGFYVYLHKNKTTGEVFYVGKGHEKRAWDAAKRNWAWKEYVANNGCEVEVEIIEDDYTENEAYDLERELVIKHGGNKYKGGTLTNLHPGGEQGEVPVIRIEFDDGGWGKHYREKRKFKKLKRKEQEALAKKLRNDLKDKQDEFYELKKEYPERPESHDEDDLDDNSTREEIEAWEKMWYSYCNPIEKIGGVNDHVWFAARNFLNRKIGWTNFGIEIGFALRSFDDLPDKDSEGCWDERSLNILKHCKEYIQRFYDSIDTGNHDEAAAFADDNCRPDEELEPMKILWF